MLVKEIIEEIMEDFSSIENICFSGGSKGADFYFGDAALKKGHKVIHWSFENHYTPCNKKDVKVLSYPQLLVADNHLKEANVYLQRKWPTISEYVNNLLRRNYYQICFSDKVYAVCSFEENMKPLGGTSWAIVMAAFNDVNQIYVFDQDRHKWFSFNRKYYGRKELFEDEWDEMKFVDVPKPSGRYAGIGASQLTKEGRNAIFELYK